MNKIIINYNKSSHSKDSITLQNIKYIILDYYQPLKNSNYSIEILTNKSRKIIISYLNKHLTNKTRINKKIKSKTKYTEIECNVCNNSIFVYNLIISNKKSTSRKRYYHFKCALEKNLVELKNNNIPMPKDYHNFLVGIII